MKYVMKLRFVIKNQTDEQTNGRTNGDIEALADAMRAHKNVKIQWYTCANLNIAIA